MENPSCRQPRWMVSLAALAPPATCQAAVTARATAHPEEQPQPLVSGSPGLLLLQSPLGLSPQDRRRREGGAEAAGQVLRAPGGAHAALSAVPLGPLSLCVPVSPGTLGHTCWPGTAFLRMSLSPALGACLSLPLSS